MAGKAARKNIGGGTWYNASGSNVASEAKERKDGGSVVSFKKKDGGKVTFKTGGTVEKKNRGGEVKRAYGGRSVGKPEGRLAGGRLDKKARGGGIRKLATGGGSDQHPFSSAHAKGGKVK